MQGYFLRRAVSQASRKTVSFQKSKSAVSLGKSKSGTQRSTSQQKLGQRPSATSRRRPVKSSPIWSQFSESRACRYFGFAMTLLLFAVAVVMVILYFHKQRKIMMEKPKAMTVIREFMVLQNKSFNDKSDSEILDEVQHLAQYLYEVRSRSDKFEKATNLIITRLLGSWKPFSGHLYYFSIAKLPAMQADEKCEQQGGRLVYITSRAEEEYLENEVAKQNDIFYIGLIKTRTIWKWVNGELLRTSYWGAREVSGPAGQCAVIFKCSAKGKCWNDVKCEESRKWICKLKPDPSLMR